MHADEIRSRFLKYFERQQHAVRPSSSLVPVGDDTLLFTNAGMVQFKKVFLGMEQPPGGARRATTSQKCVRAGGKHNDLEQVGHTYRHQTFFEMLGNFSFGDYFKREAIQFAWGFITNDLKMPKEHLRVSVFREDDEARALWREIAGLPDSRIYGLSAKDNFWQMADTGPCGPCTEVFIDLAHVAKDWTFPAGVTAEWADAQRTEFSRDAFEEGAEAGRFLEFWNLVFMQYDRQADGTLVPLPKPSVDTGMGLERTSAILQGVTNNFHIDAFAPLIAEVEKVIGIEYRGRASDAPHKAMTPGPSAREVLVDPASFRVIADHARAVAFLLADGVFPSNDGRGYVLRRILRRAVRHAWLLGRREPTLVHVVQKVIDTMRGHYPELHVRHKHLIETTRAEETRFLATIDAGMSRFDELAPARSTQGSSYSRGTISGEDAFVLYDRYGFPIDLTELMARERGYSVDISGFDVALDAQRKRSQEERKSKQIRVVADEIGDLAEWERGGGQGDVASEFVGYGAVEVETRVAAVRTLGAGRVAVILESTPFYAESGGQTSDRGTITGEGWLVDVEEVRKVDGRHAAIGALTGEIRFGRAVARVPELPRRDTERNHTATHLLHAALRHLLGEHVHQAGSLVAPDRLRFDFTNHGPVKPDVVAQIEREVNEQIWRAAPVRTDEMTQKDALASGAMALFGEKYGDVVRVVTVPGYSMELCGGTHVRNTAEIGLFTIAAETGVAAGVRRIEALTGRGAYELLHERAQALTRVAHVVGARLDDVETRVAAVVEERRALEKKAATAALGDAVAEIDQLLAGAEQVNGARIVTARSGSVDVKALQAQGDELRTRLGSGVGVLGASFADGKSTVLIIVTDDLRERGVRADALVRDVAAVAGGKGGGKPHMAQAGIPDATRLDAALAGAPAIVRAALGAA